MPTPTKGRRLGGSPAHQRHMLANLATALFEHGKITTTEARARRLRPVAERLITFAKRGDLHARRQVLTTVTDKNVVHTLFAEIGPSFAARDGGYTRITKIGPRKGDNAPLAVIELVREEAEVRSRRPRGRAGARPQRPARPPLLKPRAGARVRAPSRPTRRTRPRPTPTSRRPPRTPGPTPTSRRRPRTPRTRWRTSTPRARTRSRTTRPRATTSSPTRAENRERPGPWGSGASPESVSGQQSPGAALSGPLAASGPSAGAAFTRLRLDLSYDGSAFHGWSRQPGLRTVQQIVEEALGRALALAAEPALTVAGRTDAGVHARGQVAHLDVPPADWPPATGNVTRRLAGLLPADVRVRAIGPAPGGFDARFSALWRRYSYRVCDDPAAADPLRRHDTLWYPRPVDTARMNDAARACLGEHDFAAFCRRRERASTVRELLRLEWDRPAPGVAVATVTADAFCHNMVRALVGALLTVGDGRRPAGWLAEVLAGRTRDPAAAVVGPHGLCLEEVRYPPDDGLAARAEITRRLRPARPTPHGQP